MLSPFQVNFTLFQMTKNYCHLGHESKLLNNNNFSYLLGNYSGISIININKSFIFLKSSFNIISKIFLKNGYICFVINDKGLGFPHKFTDTSNASIFSETNWKGGTLSNWSSFKNKGPWKLRLPNAIIVSIMKEVDFFGERTRNFPILVLFFIDTIHNVFKFDSPIFINNKSFVSLMYFYYVFYNFINKLYRLKRIKFIEIIKKKILDIFTKNIPRKKILWQK
jgi:ribosomal protein S2